MKRNKISLSQQTADEILNMINSEKTFKIGDKLPNENILSAQLDVSRTTLREAIKILVCQDILEVKRGSGTFVKNNNINSELNTLNNSSDLKDLFEIRLMIEPMSAYYAAKRATDKEIEKIIEYGKINSQKIINKEDRTKDEQLFHNAIATASHNSFVKDLMPIINKAIYSGVILSKFFSEINEITLNDHEKIMNFIKDRDAQGAKIAMELHIINAMNSFKISRDID